MFVSIGGKVPSMAVMGMERSIRIAADRPPSVGSTVYPTTLAASEKDQSYIASLEASVKAVIQSICDEKQITGNVHTSIVDGGRGYLVVVVHICEQPH